MKKNVALLAAFMTLMSFAACSDITKDDNLLAENDITTISAQDTDNVAVTESEPLETIAVDACVLWDMHDEEEMYSDCDVIADVTIKSLEEIAISYIFRGTECTSYKTLATVSVNKIYYSAEENISQEFIVAIPNSSYQFDENFPEIAIDKSCILFISSTEGVEDSLKIYNYADYYLGHPADIININGLECNADEIFSYYSDNSVPVIKEPDIELLEGEELDPEYQSYGLKTGRCSMPLEDFEKTLIEKISEKK